MRYLLAFLCLFVAAPVCAQVKNPVGVAFTCADHAQDTSHEVDIVNSAGVVVRTDQGGDPLLDVNGDVVIPISVSALPMGDYTFKVRAVVGADKSTDSLPSDVWKRSPATPGKPKAK